MRSAWNTFLNHNLVTLTQALRPPQKGVIIIILPNDFLARHRRFSIRFIQSLSHKYQ